MKAITWMLGATLLALVLVPGLERETWLHPAALAMLVAAGIQLWVVGRFALTQPTSAPERKALTAFLFLMPTVYLAGAALLFWKNGQIDSRVLAIEVIGQVVFGVFAYLGATRSRAWLATGILLHGIAWDAWHLVAHAGVVPQWYAAACLVVDVGWAIFAWLRFGPPQNTRIPLQE